MTGDVFLATKGGQSRKLALVEVSFFPKNKDIKLTTTTDADGKFRISLPHGDYSVMAQTELEVPSEITGTIRPKVFSWVVKFTASEANQMLSLNNTNVF